MYNKWRPSFYKNTIDNTMLKNLYLPGSRRRLKKNTDYPSPLEKEISDYQ